VGGLLAQGALVEEIAEYAEGEDHYGETVAGVARVAAGKLGEDLVVVFLTGDSVPEDWIECN